VHHTLLLQPEDLHRVHPRGGVLLVEVEEDLPVGVCRLRRPGLRQPRRRLQEDRRGLREGPREVSAGVQGGEIATQLGKNVNQLREARGMTQEQIAKLAGVPRATWAHLESGGANPTLAVLHRAAQALQVSIEELISSPRAACRMYAKGTLPT